MPHVNKDCVRSTISQHLQTLQISSPLAHFEAQVSRSTSGWRFPHDESTAGGLSLEGACPSEVFLRIKVELEIVSRVCILRRLLFDVGVANNGDGIRQVVLDGHDSVVCTGGTASTATNNKEAAKAAATAKLHGLGAAI